MTKALSKVKTVTERDRLLMRWIGTNGIANLKQLQTVFWPESTQRTCRERLALLEKAGLIECHYVQTSRMQGEQVFTLTNQAALEYFDATLRKSLMVGLPARAELKQQLMAQEARIVLEQVLALYGKRIVRWQNERELRGEAAFYKRQAGRLAGRSGLADVADARIFIGEACGNITSGLAVQLAETRGITMAGFTFSSSVSRVAYSTTQNMVQPDIPRLSHSVSDLLVGLEKFNRVNIEIDGEYFGQMLKTKLHEINRGNQPTLWVTTPKRNPRIEEAVSQEGSTNIWIMSVEPFL